MSSVCIDVRPARLVERAAAPSGLMSFQLREREAEGAERSEERRSPGGGGGVVNALIIIMISSWVSHHDCGESAGEKGRVDVIISYCHVITAPFAAHNMVIGGRGCRSSTRGDTWAWLHKRLKASRGGGEGSWSAGRNEGARGDCSERRGRWPAARGRAVRRERKEEEAEREQGESGGSGGRRECWGL